MQHFSHVTDGSVEEKLRLGSHGCIPRPLLSASGTGRLLLVMRCAVLAPEDKRLLGKTPAGGASPPGEVPGGMALSGRRPITLLPARMRVRPEGGGASALDRGHTAEWSRRRPRPFVLTRSAIDMGMQRFWVLTLGQGVLQSERVHFVSPRRHDQRDLVGAASGTLTCRFSSRFS